MKALLRDLDELGQMLTAMQIHRRAMLVLHDVLVHPVIGLMKALSPSTRPDIASRLHDATMPPLPILDEFPDEELTAFLRPQAGYVDPGYQYMPTVTYWDEDIDGSDIEYVLYYHWSDPIPGRYTGPIELCHPPEGGAEADTVTKDGVPVELNTVPDDIYDVLMQRANEQGDGYERYT